MREKIVSILPIIICLLLPVGKCYSRLITVGITAEVTNVADEDSILEGKVTVGDIIEGTYTYDTSVPGKYPYLSKEYEFSSAPCGILLQVGGLVFQTDPNDVEFVVEIMNDILSASTNIWDRFTLRSRRNIMFIDDVLYEDISMGSISIYLEDSLLSSYGFYHPLTALLTTALPASAPVLSDWPIREIELSVEPNRWPDQWFGRGFNLKGRLISAVLVSAPPKVIYVDDDAAGANDGSSWADAYIYLQDALADANSADKPVEIRVAQGLYQPDRGAGVSGGDREATFHLLSQVAVKGGYAGLKGGHNSDHRNIRAYETILTGDLNGDDLVGFGNRLDNSYHVISAIETDETAILDGFTITSGSADGDVRSSERRSDHTICGGGLYINSANPTVVNCTFRNNFAYEYGGGLYIKEGHPRVLNGCFTGNVAGYGGGVAVYSDSNSLKSIALLDRCLMQGNSASLGGASFLSDARLVLVNCTVADNRPYGSRAIDWSESHGLGIYNSIIWNAEKQRWGTYPNYSNISGNVWLTRGNINEDPIFAAPGYWADAIEPNIAADPNDPNAVWMDGDYHLKSQAGRWDPNSESWVQDDVTSPCIDAGDPNSPIGHEPFPNGGRINMGAYGGRAEASNSYFGKPVCETIIAGDINGDCKVDFQDFTIMAAHWLEQR